MGITTEEYAELNDIFSQYDTDKDGFLNFEEVFGLMKEPSTAQQNDELPSHEEVQGFISLIDRNKDGQISFNEFLTIGFLDGSDQKEPEIKDDIIHGDQKDQIVDL